LGPRRSRFGKLIQWDTSEHDWLEGRGEKLYLIAMIADRTSRLFARFVRHDSTEENMKVLWSYLEKFGNAADTDRTGIAGTGGTIYATERIGAAEDQVPLGLRLTDTSGESHRLDDP
jgi:hypothetical protein